MPSAIVIEGLSRTLSVARSDVRDALLSVENELGHLRANVSRRVDTVISSGQSADEKADSITTVGAELLTDKEMLKFAIAIAGTIWGTQVTVAAITTAAATVTVMGTAVPVVLALLVGLLCMVLCGRYVLSVLSKIFDRLKQFQANE